MLGDSDVARSSLSTALRAADESIAEVSAVTVSGLLSISFFLLLMAQRRRSAAFLLLATRAASLIHISETQATVLVILQQMVRVQVESEIGLDPAGAPGAVSASLLLRAEDTTDLLKEMDNFLLRERESSSVVFAVPDPLLTFGSAPAEPPPLQTLADAISSSKRASGANNSSAATGGVRMVAGSQLSSRAQRSLAMLRWWCRSTVWACPFLLDHQVDAVVAGSSSSPRALRNEVTEAQLGHALKSLDALEQDLGEASNGMSRVLVLYQILSIYLLSPLSPFSHKGVDQKQSTLLAPSRGIWQRKRVLDVAAVLTHSLHGLSVLHWPIAGPIAVMLAKFHLQVRDLDSLRLDMIALEANASLWPLSRHGLRLLQQVIGSAALSSPSGQAALESDDFSTLIKSAAQEGAAAGATLKTFMGGLAHGPVSGPSGDGSLLPRPGNGNTGDEPSSDSEAHDLMLPSVVNADGTTAAMHSSAIPALPVVPDNDAAASDGAMSIKRLMESGPDYPGAPLNQKGYTVSYVPTYVAMPPGAYSHMPYGQLPPSAYPPQAGYHGYPSMQMQAGLPPAYSHGYYVAPPGLGMPGGGYATMMQMPSPALPYPLAMGANNAVSAEPQTAAPSAASAMVSSNGVPATGAASVPSPPHMDAMAVLNDASRSNKRARESGV